MADRVKENDRFLGADSSDWGLRAFIAFFIMLFAGYYGMNLYFAWHQGYARVVWIAGLLLFVFPVICSIVAGVRGRGEDRRVSEEEKREKEEKKALQIRLATPPTPDELYRQAETELQARRENALKMQRLHDLRKQVEEEERKAGIFVPTLSAAPLARPKSAPAPQQPAPATPVPPTDSDPHYTTFAEVLAMAASLKAQESAAPKSQVSASPRKPLPVAPPAPAGRPEPKPAPSGDPMAAEMAQLMRRQQEAERQKHLMKSRRAVEDAEWEADDL